MPKRNLIADHDFSSVPKLNIGNPNYQGFGAGYGLPWKVQGNGVVIENNTFIFNYEQMVNAVRVDTYNYPETKVQNGFIQETLIHCQHIIEPHRLTVCVQLQNHDCRYALLRHWMK